MSRVPSPGPGFDGNRVFFSLDKWAEHSGSSAAICQLDACACWLLANLLGGAVLKGTPDCAASWHPPSSHPCLHYSWGQFWSGGQACSSWLKKCKQRRWETHTSRRRPSVVVPQDVNQSLGMLSRSHAVNSTRWRRQLGSIVLSFYIVSWFF